MKLSAYLTNNNRAAGFGVAHWFANDDIFSEPEKTIFLSDEPCQLTSQEMWKRL
ncbi:MAG: hypothetical protein PUP92_06920 [Rhizonema sp. PD38]|nr:hypothetical protein [Rhizonema sp. PD38]